MKELRNTIYEDVKIEKVFLEEKIEAYIHEMEKLHQMKILFFYNKSMSDLSEIQKNSFYRVICEAVNNAIRHGKANTVIIIIKLQDGELVANIVDDGSGIDRLEEIEMGHGIRNMQNVIRRMRGKIDFKKNKEGGTSVSFAVPLY